MRHFSELILLLLVISGCTKDLNINFEDPSKKLVLYPFLTNNKIISIKMSGATSILSNNFPTLDNATVVITDNNVPVDTVNINANGNGSSKIIPIPGHKYSFAASANGYPEVVCIAQLPKVVEAFSVDTTHVFFFFTKYMRAQLRIKDDPNEKNFYKATVFKKRFDPSRTLISKPQLYANIPDIGFFSIWSGRFLLAQDVIDFGEGSNFRYELGSDIYFQGSEFYFPDDLLNGKEIILDILVGPEVRSPYPEKYMIELSTISQDYYLGVKSYARYGTKEDANLPISEEVSIYSAVKGGYGFPISSTTVIDSTYWMLGY